MLTGPVILSGKRRETSPNPKRLLLPVINKARRRWRQTLCLVERVIKLEALHYALQERVARFRGQRALLPDPQQQPAPTYPYPYTSQQEQD